MPHPNSKKSRAARAKRSQARQTQSATERRAAAEQHEQSRLNRDAAASKSRQARTRTRILTVTGVSVVSGLLALGFWTLVKPDPEIAGVERPTDRGGGHVDAATFDDDQPTSGAHSASAPGCRTYTEPLDPALAVHALEHGTVVLWFDPAQPGLAEDLESETTEWDSHVIISPGVNMQSAVVATAWNRRSGFDQVDSSVADFVDTYRERGPEDIACDR